MNPFSSPPSPADSAPPDPARPDFAALAARTRRTSYVALAIAVTIAAAGLWSLFAMYRSARQVEHTHEVTGALADVLADVRDADAGVRGFLLGGDSVELGPYADAANGVARHVARLRGLTGDNPAQAARVATLDSLVRVRLSVARRRLALYHQYGRDSAVAAMRGVGFRVMEQIRGVARDIDAEEARLLARRDRAQRVTTWQAALVVVVGMMVAVVMVASVNRLLLRAIRARERAEGAAVHAREQAEAANRAKSDFLASMSHELRTPLNSVIGFANVMLKNKEGRLGPGELTYLDRIRANGSHLLSLINQILDLSKIEAGRVELHVEPVDVGVLVRDVVAQFEPQLGERPVTLGAAVPADLVPLNTDGEKLRQVLINLVGNAIKFTERGSVTVTVLARGGTVGAVEVRDTGIGIPPERLAAVFDPFEQAESGTARKFGGTGLGLSISRSLALLLGAELTVESEPGRGTAFTMLFPTRAASLTPPRGARSAAPLAAPLGQAAAVLKDRLVLVIDDDPDARLLIARHLDDAGCRVIAATNGEQGLRMANTFTPDAIVLDLLMPGVDGLEVLRRLKSDPALRDTPTVVLSVVANEQDDPHATATLGGVARVTKPCSRDELVATLAGAISA